MVMKTPGNEYMARHIKHSRDLNIPIEEWDEAQILERLPIYSLDSFYPPKAREDDEFGESNGAQLHGAVYWPNGGYVTDPALSAQNLMDAAKLHGAEVRLGAEVAEIVQEGGRVKGVKLASGEVLNAPVVVNVAGPGSAIINELAGITEEMTIQTRPLRQEVVHVPSPEGFDFEGTAPVVSDNDIGCYVRPEHGNHILIGSEDPECDAHDWTADDKEYDRNFTEQWTTQAMRYAQRVPSLGIPSRTRGVVDLYDASTDWIPIYDKASLGGYYMACGTSGNQYKNAPIAGKMIAALIEYCENGNEHDEQPLQFMLPYIQRELNVGFFSRKREVNQESSFSVLG
tara:strand:+ start:33 stop:1058 length:1026 start_codon:yes stop_codon:yes gene_type:complete